MTSANTHSASDCLHRLFEARAVAQPDAIAVSHEGRHFSYEYVNSRANRIAHALRARGVTRETLVALCVQRDVELVTAIIGILKAGGVYVPLDPASPRERLQLLLNDSAASVVVTSRAMSDRFPDSEGRGLLLLEDISDASPSTNLEGGALFDSAAYVIYTSGSTGTPKGVVVEHRHVARLFSATEQGFGFGSDDVWTLFHSFAFDFSVWEIWGALLHGGRLVIVPAETVRSPRKFLELLEGERVTVLNQTPSAFHQLARAEAQSGALELSLRYIVFGGEALTASTLRDWVERHGDASPALINMYGITETTVHVTYRRVSRFDVANGGQIPIGLPICDLYVRLLDESGEPTAPGCVGEIYVGGAGVARGYLNRPELTAQRFLRDDQASEADARLYRSGDLAREQPDGQLAYVGRADAQLKIRGYRIEPGEVEQCLLKHEAVSHVLVVGRDHGEGDKTLAAYVVPTARRESLIEELRALSNAHLPAHLCPSSYVLVDELPLTTNGKVDASRLPAPEQPSAQRVSVEKRLPVSRIEKTLAEIWQRVLRVARVGLDDDFFELGGTSLGAVKVLLSIKEQLGVALDMSLWADVSTVAGFAGACSALRHASSTRSQTSFESPVSPGEMR